MAIKVTHRSVNRSPHAALFVLALALLSIGVYSPSAAAEEKPATTTAPDEASSRKEFSVDYEAGSAAAADKNWPLARQKLTSALKALGDFQDPKKSTAQVLLNKAERALVKDDALFTASELMRLKQWVEAEEAFRKVVEVSGETDTLRKNIMACRAGLEAENADLRAAAKFLTERKWKEATDAYNKASDTLGGIRMIREGLNAVQIGAEADDLFKKGPAQLQAKKWDDAFNTYKRLLQLVGETDDIKKGIAAAQAGYAEEHKTPTEAPQPLGPKQ